MNLQTQFLLHQELRRAESQYRSSLSRIATAARMEDASRLAQSRHEGALLRGLHDPGLHRLRAELKAAGEKQIQALFDQSPSVAAARRAWECTRGWAPAAAQRWFDLAGQMCREARRPAPVL